MQLPAAAARAPTWFYTCRLLDEKLSDLHRCSNLNTVKQIQAQVLKHDVHQDPYIAPKLVAAFSMIHAHVVKFGFFGSDIFVPNSLIDLYCKCGGARIDAAIWLFLEMEERDVVSWNSVIGGLVRGGEFEKACKVFDETLERDVVSWNIMLDMYAKAEEMGKVLEMFEGIPERNVVSWATMVWGYCRVGDMNISRMLFDKCPGKNLVIWTTMISGMLRRGLLMRQ
nr:pentatricopeptide repeat-containing protein At3g29230-like [Arachis hypogaea]